MYRLVIGFATNYVDHKRLSNDSMVKENIFRQCAPSTNCTCLTVTKTLVETQLYVMHKGKRQSELVFIYTKFVWRQSPNYLPTIVVFAYICEMWSRRNLINGTEYFFRPKYSVNDCNIWLNCGRCVLVRYLMYIPPNRSSGRIDMIRKQWRHLLQISICYITKNIHSDFI